MKPLFSNKSLRGDKINLTENGEHVKTEVKKAKVLNSFFSNITTISKFLSTQILILSCETSKMRL